MSADDRNIFKRLLYIDVERGPDSTGMFNIANNGVCDLLKEASPSYDFLKNKEVENLLQKAYNCSTFLVGHNRKATQGSIKDENAHPFVDGNIVLVHNGSLWNHRSVENVDVDSHAIAMALNKTDNDVEDTFNKLKGAYACVWYDNTTESLNFFRNKERPLWFYEDTNTTFFASEWLMLYYALLKEGVKWDKDKCTQLEVHKHIKYLKKPDGGASKAEAPVDITIEEPPYSFTKAQETKTGPNEQIGVETSKEKGVSLSQRKKFRNQFQNFINKNKVGSILSFIPEDYTGDDKKWIILGTIVGAPQHISGCAVLEGVPEEEVLDLCSQNGRVILQTVLSNYMLDHKNMLFQLNLKIPPVNLGKVH